jgi:hypothetical protein
MSQKSTNTNLAFFRHCANPGDVIACLAVCRSYYEITGKKVVFCQILGHPGNYYFGAVHPTTNEEGAMVTMNQKMFDMLKPLVESQHFIERFEVFNGQKITVDLDVIRNKTNVGMPNGFLASWPMYIYPDLSRDISKFWMELNLKDHRLKKQVKNKIIINFTERYREYTIRYDFLKSYATDLIFAGTEREYYLFTNTYGVNIPRLEVNDFLELGYAIKFCRFFMGNQSMCWNLANAIGKPRLLEVFFGAHNCHPNIGENNYGYSNQVGAEYLFRMMYAKIKSPK